MPRKPFAVIVDDEDQTAFADTVLDKGVEAVYVNPDDVTLELLNRATVVVLDQYLRRWPGRDALDGPISLQVPDGLALAAVLRSHVEVSGGESQAEPSKAVTFVLRTGELDRLGASLPRGAREHLLAGQYNLEWVFSKAGNQSDGRIPTDAARVAELARATALLPLNWGADSSDPGLGWLSLPERPWSADATWQIEQCRPPQHAVAQRTAGRAWMRWFLHKVLPFPTFLLDRDRLALALGLQPAALDRIFESESDLADRLHAVHYTGCLGSFMGDRWWRAGVSHLVAEILNDPDGDLMDRVTVGEAISTFQGSTLPVIGLESPVLCVQADYTIASAAVDISDAVRLQPDGWPPYADDAWAEVDDVEGDEAEPDLRAMVVAADRWQLRTEHSGAGETDIGIFLLDDLEGGPGHSA